MASGGERPDLEALRELEEVLRHFEHELASWRRRALSAESRLAEAGAEGEAPSARARALEEENHVLGQRVAAARSHLGDLLERLHFLEQQQQGNGGTGR